MTINERQSTNAKPGGRNPREFEQNNGLRRRVRHFPQPACFISGLAGKAQLDLEMGRTDSPREDLKRTCIIVLPAVTREYGWLHTWLYSTVQYSTVTVGTRTQMGLRMEWNAMQCNATPSRLGLGDKRSKRTEAAVSMEEGRLDDVLSL